MLLQLDVCGGACAQESVCPAGHAMCTATELKYILQACCVSRAECESGHS